LLKAMQTLGSDGDPHEAIASKFARIFSDRMMQKRELLERVRRGEDLSDLLAPEVDAQVDVPIVMAGESTPLSNVRKTTQVPRRKRSYAFLIAFLLASIGGAGVGAYLRLSGKTAAKQEKLAVVPLPTPVPIDAADVQVEVQAVEEVPPPAPVDQYIVISVETDPGGVKVNVDGEPRGATPLDVRVKKHEQPLHIELAQPGFDTHKLDVVPDRDQRLYFALVKREKKIVPVKTPPKKKDKGGFRRFD
jgi:hypothetical protein